MLERARVSCGSSTRRRSAAAFLAALTLDGDDPARQRDGWQLFAILPDPRGARASPRADPRPLRGDGAEREERHAGARSAAPPCFAVRGVARHVSVAGSEVTLRDDQADRRPPGDVIELRPARSLELGHLATLLTAAYEGGAVPFASTSGRSTFMPSRSYDLVLDASQVALLDGVPVALANLGIRGEPRPDRRHRRDPVRAPASGIAERLMRAVLDQVRIRGVRQRLARGARAERRRCRLDEKLGFDETRPIDVWSLDAARRRAARAG